MTFSKDRLSEVQLTEAVQPVGRLCRHRMHLRAYRRFKPVWAKRLNGRNLTSLSNVHFGYRTLT